MELRGRRRRKMREEKKWTRRKRRGQRMRRRGQRMGRRMVAQAEGEMEEGKMEEVLSSWVTLKAWSN